MGFRVNSTRNSEEPISTDKAKDIAEKLLSDNNYKMRELANEFFEDNRFIVPDPPYVPDDVDDRMFSERDVSQREGQSEFKLNLINAHGPKCMISGCDVPEAVEAAHIVPCRGDKDNNVHNGLLLRADIHALFDAQLIGIDPDTLIINASPILTGSEYSDFDGDRLRTTNPCVVGKDALKHAWNEFKRAAALRLKS